MDELISRRSRHRVRVLGELLGETMTDQHGMEFLNKIEEIRSLAKNRRSDPDSDRQLQEVLRNLSDAEMISVARAFNQFLNLANIVEQAETTAERNAPFPEVSYLQGVFERLIEQDLDKQEIFAAISQIQCDLVLTAHPTEITRRTLIQKYNRIAAQLELVNEEAELEAKDRRQLERLIAEVWYTDEIRTERPTPQDEAKWGYAVIEYSFWDAIPRIWKGLNQLLEEYTGQSLPLNTSPIRVSSWMGGDRDGNPNVTAVVTEEVNRLARWMAADLYLRDIDELLSQLSMSQCSDEVKTLCGEESHEPYRVLLRKLRERLIVTRQWSISGKAAPPEAIMTRKELFHPLKVCYDSLISCGMEIIAEGLLKETLVRVATFGVTLVDLDIRQNADKHTELLDALTQYLDLGSYMEWPETARQEFLVAELESKRPLIPDAFAPPPAIQETLDTFELVANSQAEGISSYIISMAKNPSDVLAVVLLLRKLGLTVPIPIVPLFETLDDLENAAWTLERLLRIPWYTNYINGQQQVMIGYSDSAKDAGQMAAAWAQYRAQEDLVAVSEKYDVKLTLFHGRGGTVGRGGAPAREAILSQPPGSVKGSMRVTEQGEVIRFKYGSAALALNSLDLTLSATIEATLLPPPKPRDNWRRLMDRMAETACQSYRASVRDNPEFVAFFNQSTPERELTQLALGSRPARRTNQESVGIEDLRAIPWVFAWTQKRLMLPAWLGTDEGFKQHMEGKDLHVLKEMISEWPFFQTQLGMLEMVLSKVDADIANHYDQVLVEEKLRGFGKEFAERTQSLVQNILDITQQSSLLERQPSIKRSLELRNPYTDPLHFLQIELMSRCRKDAEGVHPTVDKALMVTIAGIAASMRNTG